MRNELPTATLESDPSRASLPTGIVGAGGKKNQEISSKLSQLVTRGDIYRSLSLGHDAGAAIVAEWKARGLRSNGRTGKHERFLASEVNTFIDAMFTHA